jgi:hypothetical protein
MTDLSRRGALKAGGVGGLLALFTGAGVQPGANIAGGLTGAAVNDVAPPRGGNPLRGNERELFDALERRRQFRWFTARGEFDPDLVALKSVAPQAKMIIQRHRDEQAHTIMERLRKLVWGSHD